MKFTTVASALVGANVALGARFTQKRWEEHAKRETARTGSSLPRLPILSATDVEVGNDTAHVEYSSNWAGAVLIGTGYTSVTGTIVVPTPSEPSGGSSRTEYAASAWVGIDGDTCSTAILQTGVDFYVEGTEVSFDAWYEWYPDYAYNFNGITISAGDSITMTVTATSKSAGSAVIKNNSKGTTVTHTFSGETNTLCETNAEWIVEDFSSGNSLVPFADFNTVTFTGASATKSGTKVDTSGATIIDIQQDSILTSCSASGSSVTCAYTG